jgi:DNA-binding NarL/FixJ family response regulator
MVTNHPTSVVVVDDHRFMRELISRKLDGHEGRFKVVAEGGDVRTAVEACKRCKPHLIILDINLPDGSGIEAVSKIKNNCPSVRVLLCTAYVADDRVVEALRSGADGFVEKTNSWAEFIEAVERVSRGERYFYAKAVEETPSTSPVGRHKIALTKVGTLSGRELEVLKLVANGRSSKEVASALGVSVGTINVHRANLMKKLGTNNIATLVTFAFRVGLVG